MLVGALFLFPAAQAALIPLFWFAAKVGLILFLYMWIRGTLPRFRYDQLMRFAWKVLFPIALVNLLVTGLVVALVDEKTVATALPMDVILFLIFAIIAVVCAVNVVVQTHPISSAISLIGVMGSLAVLYLLLGAEFIAMAQVIVYAGAIMVLFVFVIMLLNAGAESKRGRSLVVAVARRFRCSSLFSRWPLFHPAAVSRQRRGTFWRIQGRHRAEHWPGIIHPIPAAV